MVWNPSLCIQLYSQQHDQQMYPQEKAQSLKITVSNLTPLCRIFKWSIHGYSTGQNFTDVVVNKGSYVCEVWSSYSDDSSKFTVFWDAGLCRLGVHYPHFGGACSFHLQWQMEWANRLHSTPSHKTAIIVHHHIYKMLTSGSHPETSGLSPHYNRLFPLDPV